MGDGIPPPAPRRPRGVLWSWSPIARGV